MPSLMVINLLEKDIKILVCDKRYCWNHARQSAISCSLAGLAARTKGQSETRIISVQFSIAPCHQRGEAGSVQPHYLSSASEILNSVIQYFLLLLLSPSTQ